ncbi:MAG: polyphenol oxidase family protein [Patescibacteria group bacterium]|nr:polyphenol oxidase family protein [Patescibacteria group bacterium]
MYTFLDNHKGVLAVMSEKEDGNMKIRGMQKDDEAVQNRKKFCQKNDIDFDNVINACVTHSDVVEVITDTKKHYYNTVDALVTKENGIYLTITTADCFPVVLYEPKAQIIAIVHAGWRGVVTKIIPNTLDAMKNLGADLQNIEIEIGPGISQENFDFGFEEMIEEFGSYNQDQYIIKGSAINKVKIDLEKIIYDQITACGADENKINASNVCTFDNDRFFSARRHGGDSFHAMMTVVGMRNDA